MTPDTDAAQKDRPAGVNFLELTFALMGGALVWLLRLVVNSSLVDYACQIGATWPLWLTTAVSALVGAAALMAALRYYRIDDNGMNHETARWLGLLGIMFNVTATGGALTTATDGALATPAALPGAWSLDPLVLVGLLLVCWWYRRGVRSLWGSAGAGNVVSRWQVTAFWCGVAALVVALVSPLDALASALFAAHMGQHLLLTLVAAPLLAISAPLQTMGWGLPAHLRRRTGRWQGRVRRLLAHPAWPGAGLALYTIVFTLWHVPGLYDASLRSAAVHGLEHATMLGSGLAFWAPVVRPRRTHGGLGVVLLFASLIASGVLAALFVFAPTPWYAHPPTQVWGLTPLQDQQLAGAVMWVPGGAVYVAAGAVALMHWLRTDRAAVERVERSAADRSSLAAPRRP
jgi:cytochrome c oxidase assembly factor CtaG